MKSKSALFFLIIIGLFALPLAVGAQDVGSMTFTCDTESGATVEITNAIPVTIRQLRSGFDYTATAVGIDGFDPVLAVLGESGDGLCSDDAPGARRYAADLPTTGSVSASNLSSQIIFNHSDSSGFQDINLVVGGLNGQVGEFLLILEGMGITAADNAGDPFVVTLTESLISPGTTLDVYMLTRGQSNVDPLIAAVDNDGNVLTAAGSAAGIATLKAYDAPPAPALGAGLLVEKYSLSGSSLVCQSADPALQTPVQVADGVSGILFEFGVGKIADSFASRTVDSYKTTTPAATEAIRSLRYAVLLSSSAKVTGGMESSVCTRWTGLGGDSGRCSSSNGQLYQLASGSLTLRNLMP